MITYKFPTPVELNMMTRKYVINRAKFKGQQIVPFKETMLQVVQWDELDAERGMTVPHEQDSDPKVTERPASRLKEYRPIFFKEKELIKESELLNARAFGTINGVVNIDDLVADRLKSRVDKDFIRAEWLIWKMLSGGFSINENGVKVSETFPVQQFNPVVPWDDHENATILADNRAICLMFRGTGASGQGAKIYVNQTDANHILANKNQNDLFGFVNSNYRKVTFSMEDLNKILSDNGLATYEIYDEGYIGADGNFTTFIPNGKPIVIGKRDDNIIGKFMLTPSLHKNKAGIPAGGFFSLVSVNGNAQNSGVISVQSLGEAENPKISVMTGFYGGPTLFYPQSVVVVNAYEEE